MWHDQLNVLASWRWKYTTKRRMQWTSVYTVQVRFHQSDLCIIDGEFLIEGNYMRSAGLELGIRTFLLQGQPEASAEPPSSTTETSKTKTVVVWLVKQKKFQMDK